MPRGWWIFQPSTFGLVHKALAAYALVACIGGCGNQLRPVPVAGRVTLGGQPLANAHVSFQPLASETSVNPGPGSYGETDAQGRYTLQTVEPTLAGAVVGRHKVRISLAGPKVAASDISDAPAAVLPPVAGDGSLEIDIPSQGNTAANFDL